MTLETRPPGSRGGTSQEGMCTWGTREVFLRILPAERRAVRYRGSKGISARYRAQEVSSVWGPMGWRLGDYRKHSLTGGPGLAGIASRVLLPPLPESWL